MKVEGLDLHRVVLVPIMQNSEHKNSQRACEGKYLADCRDADAEDEHCPENEKQTGGAFDWYVMDRDAGMIGNWIIRRNLGAELPAFICVVAEQDILALRQ